MPFTKTDIQALIRHWLAWNNDPKLWCKKDENGDLITNAENQYLRKDYKEELVPWVPLKVEQVFVYIYCYHDESDGFKDFYEEWYISELTETMILLRRPETLTPDTEMIAVPLSRIAEISVGA